MLSAFTSVAYIQVHLRLDFIMEADIMNADQTATLAQLQSSFTQICGSVVECLTRDQGTLDVSLTSVTVLCP